MLTATKFHLHEEGTIPYECLWTRRKKSPQWKINKVKKASTNSNKLYLAVESIHVRKLSFCSEDGYVLGNMTYTLFLCKKASDRPSPQSFLKKWHFEPPKFLKCFLISDREHFPGERHTHTLTPPPTPPFTDTHHVARFVSKVGQKWAKSGRKPHSKSIF